MRIRRSTSVAAASLSFAILALTGCTAAEHTSPDGETTVDEIALAEEEFGASTYAEGMLTTTRIVLRITETRVIPMGEPGNEYGEAPVFAVWYETINSSGEEIDPLTAWLTHFRAVQTDEHGGVAELSFGMPPEARFEGTMSSPIEKGATVQNAVAYLLADDGLPVELIASDLRLNELGRTAFPLA